MKKSIYIITTLLAVFSSHATELEQKNSGNQHRHAMETISSRKENRMNKAFLNAAMLGNLPNLKEFKKKGADVRATDQDGNNALHYVTLFASNFSCAEWLLETAKIPVDSIGSNGGTPFLISAYKGKLGFLKFFRKKGANVNVRDLSGHSALHLAILGNADVEIIKWLLDIVNVTITSKGKHQMTLFHWAASKGHIPALKFLARKGAHVRAQDAYGYNALHFAAIFSPDGKAVEWLIDTIKISIEAKGEHQKTPFLCAAQEGNIATLETLKAKGANLNAKDENQYSALYLAIMNNNVKVEVIEWLLDTAQLSIELKGKYNITPFIFAAQCGRIDALKVLRSKGAKVNAKDIYGNNALHFAALFSKNVQTITWLIHIARIPIESRGECEVTPFLCAAKKGNLPALKILKEKGANVKATAKNGNNALYYAQKYSNSLETITWLKNIFKN